MSWIALVDEPTPGRMRKAAIGAAAAAAAATEAVVDVAASLTASEIDAAPARTEAGVTALARGRADAAKTAASELSVVAADTAAAAADTAAAAAAAAPATEAGAEIGSLASQWNLMQPCPFLFLLFSFSKDPYQQIFPFYMNQFLAYCEPRIFHYLSSHNIASCRRRSQYASQTFASLLSSSPRVSCKTPPLELKRHHSLQTLF